VLPDREPKSKPQPLKNKPKISQIIFCPKYNFTCPSFDGRFIRHFSVLPQTVCGSTVPRKEGFRGLACGPQVCFCDQQDFRGSLCGSNSTNNCRGECRFCGSILAGNSNLAAKQGQNNKNFLKYVYTKLEISFERNGKDESLEFYLLRFYVIFILIFRHLNLFVV